jgi:hypothetical protein
MIFIFLQLIKLLFFALALTPYVALGLVFSSEHGIYWGLGLGLLFNLILHFWGDRFVLSKLWGRRARRLSWLEKMAKNIEVVTKASNVKVYTTDFIPNEITIIDGGKGRKAIVLGSEALKILSPTELESVFVKAFFDLNSGKWRMFTILSSYFIPYVLLLKAIYYLVPFESLRMMLGFLFSPTSIIKNILCWFAQALSRDDQNLPEKFQRPLSTAINKLSLLESTNEDQVTYELIRHNIFVPRTQNSLLKVFDKVH